MHLTVLIVCYNIGEICMRFSRSADGPVTTSPAACCHQHTSSQVGCEHCKHGCQTSHPNALMVHIIIILLKLLFTHASLLWIRSLLCCTLSSSLTQPVTVQQ